MPILRRTRRARWFATGLAAVAALTTMAAAPVTAAHAATAARPATAAHGAYTCDNGATPEILTDLTAPPKPPAGFRPLTASDADLAAYGFPKRPKHGAAGEAAWTDAMKHWKSVGDTAARWRCPGMAPHGPGGNDTLSSANWAGNVDPASSLPGPIDDVHAVITGPVVSPDYNHCDMSVASPWVGIGGGTGGSGSWDQLVQTGEDVDAACGQGQWTRLWYEVYPDQGTTYVSPFSTGPGDNVYFEASTDGASCATFYMQKISSGVSASWRDCFSGRSGGQADFVVEKLGNYPLAQWSTWGANQIDFLNSYAHVINNYWVSAGQPFHHSYYMTSWLNGAEIASGGAWTDSAYSSFPVKRYGNQSQ